MFSVKREQGVWSALPNEVRICLVRNHLRALEQRRAVALTRKEAFERAERYVVESTGRYPWEMMYWRHGDRIAAALGLCAWTCDASGVERTLAGIDDFFASPNLGDAARRKEVFVARLYDRMEGKGEAVELGRVHNLFEEKEMRQAVAADALQETRTRFKAMIQRALEKREHVAVIALTPASFYDPLGEGEFYLEDPGLVAVSQLIQWLVKQGCSLRSVLVATSMDGVERLTCCGKALRDMLDEAWASERSMYEAYGAGSVDLFEYETVDGRMLRIQWPCDYASRTWEEYAAWLSDQKEPTRMLGRALSLMKQRRLAPFPWRLCAFVF